MSLHRCSSIQRDLLIVSNPKSGSGTQPHLIQQLSAALADRGYTVQVTSCLETLKRDVDLLNGKGSLEAVIAAGGDGTVGVLANLLPANVPIAIFPLGTENLLARHWGITNDVEAACRTLQGGRVVHMDVGSANGKLFLIMLSCGFDAEVVHRMHASRKGHIRRWMYTMPILRSLMSYQFPMISCQTCDYSDIRQTRLANSAAVPWVFLFNVPRYAGSLDICPQADPTDGCLDLCTFEKSGVVAGLYYAFHAWRGTHQDLTEFHHQKVHSLTILPPSDARGRPVEVPFQIDGDPGGILPLNVETLPGRLRLIVPETTATSDPVPAVVVAAAT